MSSVSSGSPPVRATPTHVAPWSERILNSIKPLFEGLSYLLEATALRILPDQITETPQEPASGRIAAVARESLSPISPSSLLEATPLPESLPSRSAGGGDAMEGSSNTQRYVDEWLQTICTQIIENEAHPETPGLSSGDSISTGPP